MPFPLTLLSPRHSSSRYSNSEYDSDDSADSDAETAIAHASSRKAPTATTRTSSSSAAASNFLIPPSGLRSGRSSACSSNAPSPYPSRPSSPLPQYLASAPSSTYNSDADDTSDLLIGNAVRSAAGWWSDDSPAARRWWALVGDRRNRTMRGRGRYASRRRLRRILTMILRHPLFPTQPTSILLCLLFLTIFAIVLTLLLIHILNPDKDPLPWRAYCTIPSAATGPPSLAQDASSPQDSYDITAAAHVPFPPPNLDALSTAGVFLGTFSMDTAFERRMLIRSSWATHHRSRNGAGIDADTNSTSRTIVRFILGKPRKDWEKRIMLEAEVYKDMIILPIAENMNSGKTFDYFSWAAKNAWVPAPASDTHLALSYKNESIPAPERAIHDPAPVHDYPGEERWVRPDFVVKADDDAFVMLAELEARLRVELHSAASRVPPANPPRATSTSQDLSSTSVVLPTAPAFLNIFNQAPTEPLPLSASDPLVYWGYLVKNQFMAGELYALSWALVRFSASDPRVKSLTKGAEDKQVAKMVRLHPRASQVRWKSERCWIYDHPRAGTVYSHGFLFPSEVTRVRNAILSYFGAGQPVSQPEPADPVAAFAGTVNGNGNLTAGNGVEPFAPARTSWTYSSVTNFGTRYAPPVQGLTPEQGVEALVEGSVMSYVREGGAVSAEEAWMRREGRARRYEGRRVGGTVVVHFIKKNAWWLETALALLGGAEDAPMDLYDDALR